MQTSSGRSTGTSNSWTGESNYQRVECDQDEIVNSTGDEKLIFSVLGLLRPPPPLPPVRNYYKNLDYCKDCCNNFMGAHMDRDQTLAESMTERPQSRLTHLNTQAARAPLRPGHIRVSQCLCFKPGITWVCISCACRAPTLPISCALHSVRAREPSVCEARGHSSGKHIQPAHSARFRLPTC